MRKLPFLFIAIMLSLVSCSKHQQDQRTVIPAPSHFHLSDEETFKFSDRTRIVIQPASDELRQLADTLSVWLQKATGLSIPVEDFSTGTSLSDYILLSTYQADTSYGREGYKLQCGTNGVIIHAVENAGIFYGIQSLKQLFPPEAFGGKPEKAEIPGAYISDIPRYPYRGMHLDVSRHFFPVSFIKRYIDLLSFYKMNTFHWHLTDDNGWRIEIRKYPELTRKAAWHVDRNHQRWNEVSPPEKGEKATVGGFYTQEEIKEVVRYAASRYVTIIPEIEMPGHTSEVFAAYPNLSCKGDTLMVQPGTYWPNVDIFCAGNDDVFIFINDVLTEVAELFPGPYIHIGGDEADKTRWKECKKCQKRIVSEKLDGETELQSWFIHKVEKMVLSKGKKMIGWDEILEGGLAPEATVMSWRGMDGGIEAARMGHDVIMTPTSHCYFDYYQADPETEPEAIGGFLTLKKVYSFEPTPPTLNNMEAKHILGAQGNVWSEFIPTSAQAEYMAVPRMIALAEVVWSKTKNRDYESFIRRMQYHYSVLDQLQVNYGPQSKRVDINLTRDEKTGKLLVSLETELYQPELRYTTDGTEPGAQSQIYTMPIEIEGSTTVKAVIFNKGAADGKSSERVFQVHKATGAKVSISPEPSFKYKARGPQTLTDATLGSQNHSDGCSLGFEGTNAEIVIDLGSEMAVDKIELAFIQNLKAWIMLPDSVAISGSASGDSFQPVAAIKIASEKPQDQVYRHAVSIPTKGTNVRFIKVNVKNGGPLPASHLYPGMPAWMFIDEVVVL